MNYELTAEELLSQSYTLEVMSSELGDDIASLCEWIKDFHAKTKNYKEDTYYHAHTFDVMGSGVGEGLYLGKDMYALVNFYVISQVPFDIESVKNIFPHKVEFATIDVYKGNPNFLDMTNRDDFENFKKFAKDGFPNEENNNELRKLTLKVGYDGIRYYDPLATGEEFVLYNTNKVKLIKTEKIEL